MAGLTRAGATKSRRLPAQAASDHPIGPDEAIALLAPLLAARGDVLLAVSGGPDSIALMRMCSLLAAPAGVATITVASVDHGLRADSRAEAERVGGWARECGFPHAILTWEGPKPATRVQELARAARYLLLGAKARDVGARILVTAHTRDDQAETVLMRMAHGSGIAGLAGMRPMTARDGLLHARPLIGISKARLVATCRANGWPFIEDPSNADPRFARARWRKLAPLLEREGLTARRLANLAERAAQVEAALEMKAVEGFQLACSGRDPDGLSLDMARLAEPEPVEIAMRVLRLALADLQGGPARHPPRLERLEGAMQALRLAFAARQAMRRSLAGAVLAYDGASRLSLRREAPRRRGRARKQAGGAGEADAQGEPRGKPGNSNASMVLV